MLEKLTNEELDQITDDWLRQHDEYYTKKDKWKTKNSGCYLTEKQLEYRRRKEIPFSNLFKHKLKEIERHNVDTTNMYQDY